MKTYTPWELFNGWSIQPSKAAVAKLRQEIAAGRLVPHTVDSLGNTEFSFLDGQDECRHLAVVRQKKEVELGFAMDSFLFCEAAV